VMKSFLELVNWALVRWISDNTSKTYIAN
jgi:hypothetical protein